MRLLLIEDDPMIGESMEEVLRRENYAVDWVRDGDNALLELLVRHRGLHHLRKKLGNDFIQNVRGVGYKLAAA
jgi:DNA-binding response OmpR family regulator